MLIISDILKYISNGVNINHQPLRLVALYYLGPIQICSMLFLTDPLLLFRDLSLRSVQRESDQDFLFRVHAEEKKDLLPLREDRR